LHGDGAIAKQFVEFARTQGILPEIDLANSAQESPAIQAGYNSRQGECDHSTLRREDAQKTKTKNGTTMAAKMAPTTICPVSMHFSPSMILPPALFTDDRYAM